MQEFLQALTDRFASEQLLVSSASLAAFESDGLTAFAVKPQAIVFPESTDEVVDLIRLCHDYQVPFVARGSGTSLSGGSLPHADGIVIALNKLSKITTLDPHRRIAVVGPGTINSAVSRAAAPYGLQYAPDPSSQQVCTIGGNLAFNAGGAHCLKYGMTSNHILGMKVILPDGEMVEMGSQSLEQIGPDWTGMFVGSEGLLGIAVEITLRLIPIPEFYYTVLAGYPTLESAGEAVAAIIGSGLLPGALEIMDRLSMQAASAAVGAEYPADVEAVLIVELDGSRDSVEADKIRLDRLISQSGATASLVAASTEERMRIWKGRKSVFSAVGRLSPDFIVQDGVVPRGKLGTALREIQRLGKEFNISVANVFHAGDGNLHPLIMFDGRQPGALHDAERLAGRIVQLCIDLGGSITGEHGVGMEKRQFLGYMFDDDSLAWMQRVRLACDDREISNRGKMFPNAEADSLSLYGLHPLEKAGVASRM